MWTLGKHKSVLALLMITLCSLTMSAEEGVEFKVSGPVEAEKDTESELKQQAVLNWLRGRLGSQLDAFASEITPEVAEGYIMDYRVKRNSANTQMQLSGHIDGKSLMRFVRLKQAKSQGGANIRPFLVVSSVVPDLLISSRETRSRTMDTPFARSISKLSSDLLQKYSVNLFPMPDSRLPLLTPPNAGSDIARMRAYGERNNFNAALWFHLTPCRACGGIRLQTYFYNLNQDRPAIVRSDNVRIASPQYRDPSATQNSLSKAFQGLEDDFKEMVSSGSISSQVHQLIVEAVPSYQAYRKLNNELSEADFFNKAVLKVISPGRVSYEILAQMSPAQIAQRLQVSNFSGFELQSVRVDSDTVVMRYLGQE